MSFAAAGLAPWALKWSLEDPLFFACRTCIPTELSSNRLNAEVHDTMKTGTFGERFIYLKKFYTSCWVRAIALLSSKVLHFLYLSSTPEFICPGRFPSCFLELLSSVFMSAGLTFTSSEVIYQLLVAVWLSLDSMARTSLLFYLSVQRNSYYWTQETFIKDMTADLLQRAAGFL